MLHYSSEDRVKLKAEYYLFQQSSANAFVSEWEEYGGGWEAIIHYCLSCSQLNMSHT